MSDCIFCKIIAGEIPSEKVYEDRGFFAFSDINPQAPYHILVIPKKHISKIAEMEEGDKELVGGLFSTAVKICSDKAITDYRLVINNGEGAGQAVFHIHLHILAGRDFEWPPG